LNLELRSGSGFYVLRSEFEVLSSKFVKWWEGFGLFDHRRNN